MIVYPVICEYYHHEGACVSTNGTTAVSRGCYVSKFSKELQSKLIEECNIKRANKILELSYEKNNGKLEKRLNK